VSAPAPSESPATRAAHEVITALCASLSEQDRRDIAHAIGSLAEVAYAYGKRDGAREVIDRFLQRARVTP